MDDGRLTDGLARDLDGSFEALVRAHQDRLFSLALRYVGDAHDAEEIAQDAFVRAYRALAGYPTQQIEALAIRPWLSTIVLNMCRNRGRARAARPATTDLEPLVGVLPGPNADTPHERTARREANIHWAGLVASLPHRYRAAVVLRHVDGLSYEEMSDVLGRPEGTVKAQVHRGLKLLRAAFEAAEREESIA
jgi:RNA polymerase sigma factor (sigma-70 family)